MVWIYRTIRYFLFAAALFAVAAAYYFELHSYLTLENLETIKTKLGWWAPIVFVLAFVVGELLQIPSVLWIFFAGLIWPWWFALPVSMLAALLAATTAFLVARYFLGHGFHKKLPDSLQALNEKLQNRPVSAVIVVRLTTFLHPIMHWVLAASSVQLAAFLTGTLIGILPLTIAIVLLGEAFMYWWDQYSTMILLTASGVAAAYVIYARRRRKSLKQAR